MKARGALVLDSVARELALPLDIFMCASSLAALYGNPYQAVYAAANARVEALAAERRAKGEPATVVDLPMMLGAGRLSDFEYAHSIPFAHPKPPL